MKEKTPIIVCLLAAVILILSFPDVSTGQGFGVIELDSVSVTPLAEEVTIIIVAQGMVDEFGAFHQDDPSMIVFSFPRLKSPHRKTKTIRVDSEWVSAVRYLNSRDRVRLEIDTQGASQIPYTVRPLPSGVSIHVGATYTENVEALEEAYWEETGTVKDASPEYAETGEDIYSEDTEAVEDAYWDDTEPVVDTGSPAALATRMESLSFDPGDEGIRIVIRANGTIRDYKSFPLDDPPRIVLDLFGVKSPHESPQALTTGADAVSMIRYFGHPDKVRIVLETTAHHLSFHKTVPVADGLEIIVGSM